MNKLQELTSTNLSGFGLCKSTQAKPYVYMGIHKITGQIYAGYREANKLPSDVDLFIYRTSSKIVHPIFDEFDWYIVAEFFTGIDAFDFEQQLISEHWGNPLLLNRHCSFGKARWKPSSTPWNKGIVGVQKDSAQTRIKKSAALLGNTRAAGRQISNEEKIIRSTAMLGINKCRSLPTKGQAKKQIECPHCGKNGAIPNMKRWHFDNCTEAPIILAREPVKHIGMKYKSRTRVTCPHCDKVGGDSNMRRYHFDNCKNAPAIH